MDKPQGGVRKRAPGQSSSQASPWFGRALLRAWLASPERLVAIGRIAVAGLLLGVLSLIDSQPWRLTAALLAAYLAAALALGCLPRRLISSLSLRLGVLVDAGVLAALVALGAEPAALYLLLAAFIVLTATIRWQWKGALVCAGALAVLLAGADYAQLIIDDMREPVATVANDAAVPPPTTGSLGGGLGLRFGLPLARAAEVLAFGVMFAILAVVAGRMAARSERARLARDMHDTVLQDLAAANLILATASVPANGLKQTVAEVSELLSEQQRRIRLMLAQADVAPVPPTETAVDLQSLAAELGRKWRCNVAIDLNALPDAAGPRLIAELGLMLREAVANAVRHAGASRVHVAVAHGDDVLRVTFTDDGRSRTSGSMASPASLAARVASLGGSIDTRSGVGGVMVTVEIPL